jgi:hypothetical protein
LFFNLLKRDIVPDLSEFRPLIVFLFRDALEEQGVTLYMHMGFRNLPVAIAHLATLHLEGTASLKIAQ